MWSVSARQRTKSPRWLFLVCLSLGAAALLSSCARLPADLERIKNSAHGDALASEDLGQLLETALGETGEHSSLALARFVEQWTMQRKDQTQGIVVSNRDAGEHEYRVRFTGGDHGGYPLTYFELLSPAADYRVKRLEHFRREGVGAPLVAERSNRQESALEAFYPPEAITRPLTAMITQKSAREIHISLLCPLLNDQVLRDGKKVPLAADFTVPWAALLSRTGRLHRRQFTETFRKSPERDPQLYLMEPYDPNKEPLILIHGLFNTPLVWASLSNSLWANESIRRKYQIWHFLYDTSAPALYSGRVLRSQLREVRKLLDPTGKDPAMKRTSIVAHSMGGILTKSLITRPGDAFWDRAFTAPLLSLRLSDSDRANLQEAFFWEPEAHVRRVIYLAVPHRGSRDADNLRGWIGRFLVKPPARFADFYARISEANPGAFTPEYERLGSGMLDSVHALSPKQPTLQILAQLPNAHPVDVHSIIGTRGKDGPLKESSDGTVDYWSSHLPDADSEKIVPAGHGLIDHPETIIEIKRILTAE